MQRFASLLRSPFSFLFARSSTEERVAAYVIREHGRGRELDARLLLPVAANERCELEDDVVELACRPVVGAHCTHECARTQPFSAEHRVPRGRDRDDDVLLGRLAVALRRLRIDALAER